VSNLNKDSRAALKGSWETNAQAWTKAIREGKIESRRLVTNEAIVQTILQQNPKRVLDVGCGEGWLARALSKHGAQVIGTDASAPLIETAKAAGGGEFYLLTYEQIAQDPHIVGQKFDAIALNFALLDEEIVPLLGALNTLLNPEGKLIVQTVHPWAAKGDQTYRSGWRTETFEGFGGEFAEPMPWYYRTLEDWFASLESAGLRLIQLYEPRFPEQNPLSLLMICRKA